MLRLGFKDARQKRLDVLREAIVRETFFIKINLTINFL